MKTRFAKKPHTGDKRALKDSAMKSREERFWEKVNKAGPVNLERPELGPCWIWTAAKTPLGYGAFQWATRHTKKAYRAAYELTIGAIPEGLVLDHLCRVPACVNPAHLEPKTNLENLMDPLSRFTGHTNKYKTHCQYGHPLEGENLYADVKRGKRKCKTCRRREGREYDRRRYAFRQAQRQAKRSPVT